MCHRREGGTGTAVERQTNVPSFLYKTSGMLLAWPSGSLKNTSTAIYNNTVRSHLHTNPHGISSKPKKGDTTHSLFGSHS